MHNKSSVGEAEFLYLVPLFALHNQHLLSLFGTWCLPWTPFTFVHILVICSSAAFWPCWHYYKKKNQKLKTSGEVTTETVKYLTLFTASLDKNQIYFLVKKNSSTHFMCTDSGRFIAAHWNKGFHMCCSEGNILSIFSCLPPVSFTHSVISQLQLVFPRPKRTQAALPPSVCPDLSQQGLQGVGPCSVSLRTLRWAGAGVGSLLTPGEMATSSAIKKKNNPKKNLWVFPCRNLLLQIDT